MTARVSEAVVAIDGGNSKTDVVVAGLDGGVVLAMRGDGFRPDEHGRVESLRRLRALVEEARAAAGGPRIAVLSACLANVDLAAEEDAARAAVAAWGIASRTVVRNDVFALLRAGLDDPVGVAVVCGAGINAVGIGADGEIVRYAALGPLTGDWGGGMHLALEVMAAACRAEDGRGDATLLNAVVARTFSRPSALAVAEDVHRGAIPRQELHRLVPALVEAAADGDAIAGGLVRQQGEEVALLAVTTLERAGLANEPAVVVLGGGVLASGSRLLLGTVRRRVAERASLASIRIAESPPVVGAALLALDRLPSAVRSARELRSALEESLRGVERLPAGVAR
jgi:N-acetylglucosamine kinase-like BadF-type ATPase